MSWLQEWSCGSSNGRRNRRTVRFSTRRYLSTDATGTLARRCRRRIGGRARQRLIRADGCKASMTEPALVEDYHAATSAERHLPEHPILWDETLRDGEQTPGVHFSPEEKLRIAELLSDVGIPILNAGIPVVSEKEARAVDLLAHAGLKAKVLAAARTVPADIDAVIKSGATHIAIFVAASNVHLLYKLKMTQDEVLAASLRSVRQAKQAGLHVAFVTEDTVR